MSANQLQNSRERLQNLFRYLSDLQRIRTPPPLRLEQHAWQLQVAQIPEHPAISWGIPEEDDYLLQVKRPRLTECLPPPGPLHGGIEPSWRDPNKEVSFQPDFPFAKVFGEHPNLTAELKAWVDNREAWAKLERPNRVAESVFARLYQVHNTLARESESFELLLGEGNLVTPGARPVHHPLLLQPLELDFSADLPAFTLRETTAPTRLYTALLRSQEELDGQDIGICQAQVEQLDVPLLAPGSTLKAHLESMIHRLYPREGRFLDAPPSPRLQHPAIYQSPCFFLAKRNQGYAEAVEGYLEYLEEATEIPSSLARILGTEPPSSSEKKESDGLTPDILLTMPANDAQRQIVSTLERTGNVLVQGPPGTGKTHTIANLLGHLLAQGRSVLVTSHTTKALRVVRHHLVPELRPLCVSVLDSDRESRQQMEEAISGIVARYTSLNAAQLDRQISQLQERRKRLQSELLKAETQLRGACQKEHDPIILAGKPVKPLEAARWVHEHRDRHHWIPGPVSESAPQPLSDAEFTTLYATNQTLSAADELALQGELPDLEKLATPQELKRHLVALSELKGKDTSFGVRFWSHNRQESVQLDQLMAASEEAAAAIDDSEPWKLHAMDAGRQAGDDKHLWLGLLQQLQQTLAELSQARRVHMEHGLELPEAILQNPSASLETCRTIEEHLSKGGNLGWFTLLRRSDWKGFIDTARIGGRSPTTADEFSLIAIWLNAECLRLSLSSRWERQMVPLGAERLSSGADIERLGRHYSEALSQALDWHTRLWQPLYQQFAKQGVNWESLGRAVPPIPGDVGELYRLRETFRSHLIPTLQARLQRFHLERAERAMEALDNPLTGIPAALDKEGIARGMREVIHQADPASYERLWKRLKQLHHLRKVERTRKALLDKLDSAAPTWSHQIAKRIPPHEKPTPPGEIKPAWRWRQLEQELERRSAIDPDRIQQKVSQLRREQLECTAQLVDAMAWRRQHERITPTQQQALVGWSDTIRKIGKGTGKRAPRLRRQARKQMKSCQDAVPVWIMPMARVVETYDFRRSRFDVVILDEASQSDVLGLLALALGKHVVVVGDHQQVSPSAVGQRVDQVEKLIDQYLKGIPNAHLYDGKTSVYDIARQSFGGTIRLIEHFRCVPDIIEFSNQLSYNGEIRPLREVAGVQQRPHVIPHVVSGGARDGKTNPAEALEIASLLIAATEHPVYADCSFGVISLIGGEQAALIEQLLQKHLSPSVFRKHNILCGTAAHFQGDERDIIFLSMVDSPDPAGPLRRNQRENTKQRYNVAASRARNQMWVVHSLRPEFDLKSGDLRRQLIEYALNYKTAQAELRRLEPRTDSPFEQRVLRYLVKKGYRVHPQWPVGAYRIDLVVEGSRGRVAIECDGERFHGPDQLQADLERQEVLERMGWRFIRIRGSRYFRDPPGTMDWVVQRMEDLDIEPVGTQDQTLAHDAKANELKRWLLTKAASLRETWAQSDESEEVHTSPAPTPTPPTPAPQPPPAKKSGVASTSKSAGAPKAAKSRTPKPDDSNIIQLPLPPAPPPPKPPTTRVQTGRSKPSASPKPKGNAAPRKQPVKAIATRIKRDPVLGTLVQIYPEVYKQLCFECDQETTLYVGRKGPFIKCTNKADPHSEALSAEMVEELAELLQITCAKCDQIYDAVTGRYGNYLRCPDKKCDNKESWKEARNRLRATT